MNDEQRRELSLRITSFVDQEESLVGEVVDEASPEAVLRLLSEANRHRVSIEELIEKLLSNKHSSDTMQIIYSLTVQSFILSAGIAYIWKRYNDRRSKEDNITY